MPSTVLSASHLTDVFSFLMFAAPPSGIITLPALSMTLVVCLTNGMRLKVTDFLSSQNHRGSAFLPSLAQPRLVQIGWVPLSGSQGTNCQPNHNKHAKEVRRKPLLS